MNQDNEKLKGKIEKILLEFAEFAGYGQRTDQMCEAEIVNATDELLTLYTEEIAKGKEEDKEISFYDFEFWVGHFADFDFDYGEVKRVMDRFTKQLLSQQTKGDNNE